MFGKSRLLRQMLRKRYVFTLDSGEAFTGVLEDADAASVVLQSVTVHQTDGNSVSADGRLILERSRLLYMQEA